MSRARPLPLPPSGISVWRPLSDGEGLVAILGSGPAEGESGSGEDVQCVWCGLRSRPAAACEVCGSPLYDSIAIWQQATSTTVVEARPAPRAEPELAPTALAPTALAPAPARAPAQAASVLPEQQAPWGMPAFARLEEEDPSIHAAPAPVELETPVETKALAPPVESSVETKPSEFTVPDPKPRVSTFKTFRRFAGLEIRWVAEPTE